MIPDSIAIPSRPFPVSSVVAELDADASSVWIARPYGLDVFEVPSLAYVETWEATKPVGGVALDPRGRWVALLTEDASPMSDKTISIFDRKTRALLTSWRATGGGRGSLRASPSGRYVVMTTSIGAEVWELGPDCTARKRRSCRPIFAFSPDEASLFDADNGVVRELSLPEASERRTIRAGRARVTALAALGGGAIAIGSVDPSPRKRPLLEIVGETGATSSLDQQDVVFRLVSARGTDLFVVYEHDGVAVHVRPDRSGRHIALRGYPRATRAAGERYAVVATMERVEVIDLESRCSAASASANLSTDARDLAFTDGALVLSEGALGPPRFRAYDLETGAQIDLPARAVDALPRRGSHEGRGFRAKAVFEDTTFRFMGDREEVDSLVVLTDAADNEIARLGDHHGGVVSMTFSADGESLLSVGGGIAHVWSTATHASVFHVGSIHEAPKGFRPRRAEFTVDGGLVAWGPGASGTEARLFDLGTGLLIGIVPGGDFAAGHLGRRLIAVASEIGAVEVWNAERTVRLSSEQFHRAAARAMTFDTAGTRLAIADRDGIVRVVDVAPATRSS